MKFLIIDDDVDFRKLAIHHLHKEFPDAVCTEITERHEFDAAMKQGGIDAVITDYDNPGLDGLEVIKEAKKLDPYLPVIMLTASGSEEIAVDGMKLGLSDYVTKHHVSRLPVAVKMSIESLRLRKDYDNTVSLLRTSEERFNAFMDNTPVVCVIMDEAGRAVYINRAFERAFNVTPDKILCKPASDVLPREIARISLSHNKEVLEKDQAIEIDQIIPAPDGDSRHWMLLKFPLKNAHGKRYIGAIALDITERKHLEEKLQAEKDISQSYLNVAGVIIAALDSAGNITLFNRKGCEISGYTPHEILRKNWFDVLVPARLKDELLGIFQKIMNGGIAEYTHFENPIVTKTGEERIISWENAVLTNKEGEITGMLCSGNDVTERKHAEEERERLREQLFHAQKMESIGNLAGGIAHDFNNILMTIVGYGNLLYDELKNNNPALGYAQTIVKTSMRAAELTKGLLAFSRKQPYILKSVDINDVIKHTSDLLLRLIRANIRITTVLTGKDCVIMGDGGQIEQVLMNLATNAQDAMPEGGALTISSDVVDIDNIFLMTQGFGNIGRHVLISVSDTGAGMDKRTKERIFEPFFTTKEVGKGTGLGLAIVYGIIKQHSGHIHVESSPGRGATFNIYLPLAQKAVETQPLEIAERPAGGAETILIAEDDRDIRKLLKTLLSVAGYRVIDAANGSEAVDLFTKNSHRVQLVLLDVVMPIKSGKEAYLEIAKIKPGVKALFLTGYDKNIIQDEELIRKGIEVIMKPIIPANLLKKIRETLDK